MKHNTLFGKTQCNVFNTIITTINIVIIIAENSLKINNKKSSANQTK